MKASIITIGNSKGIRIPKPLLEESELGVIVEIKAKRGEIKIIPLTLKRIKSLKRRVCAEFKQSWRLGQY